MVRENNFEKTLTCWESKRLIYNIVTLSGGLIAMFLRGDVPNGIRSYEGFIMMFFWLFGANIFYTFGWVLEVLSKYYFKSSFFKNRTRQIFFVLGTIFSFLWMFMLSSEVV